jgi:acyl dehydratase
MTQVLDPPKTVAPPQSVPSMPVDTEQGVIEEARRRRRRRRGVALASLVAAGMLTTVGWALIEASRAARAHGGGPFPAAADAADAATPEFNVRLAPSLYVGQAGWRSFEEEHGRSAGGSAVGPAFISRPIISGGASFVNGSHVSKTILITAPNVAAILVERKTRVPTVALPGLPYGFRGARFVTPVTVNEERLLAGPGSASFGPKSLVALDAAGNPIAAQAPTNTPSQADVHRWQAPAHAPQGECGLSAAGVSALTVVGGRAATAIRSFAAAAGGRQLVGGAFLPCVSVEYRLHGEPLQGAILLNAADPGALAGELPDFNAVTGAPGFVDEGGLTARRTGHAWLVVGQGTNVGQRIALLRHLSAIVKVGGLVPASTVRGGATYVQPATTPPPVPQVNLNAAPALEAGALGWQLFETTADGWTAGAGCCFVLTAPAQVKGFRAGASSHGWQIATVLTAPEVASVSLQGRPRVPTRAGDLPDGLRFAVAEVRHFRGSAVAFDAHGRRITTPALDPFPKHHGFEGPYSGHQWIAPAAPPAGPCQLTASTLAGLETVGGDVVVKVTGYPVFESRALQSCADTVYELAGAKLTAAILLDAEHPGSKPPALPGMTAIPGASGVFQAPAGPLGPQGPTTAAGQGDTLIGKRLPGAWLVVGGGDSVSQQRKLLEHITASIHL